MREVFECTYIFLYIAYVPLKKSKSGTLATTATASVWSGFEDVVPRKIRVFVDGLKVSFAPNSGLFSTLVRAVVPTMMGWVNLGN
jgi:hypothetical protein